jgi:hypothetical protein
MSEGDGEKITAQRNTYWRRLVLFAPVNWLEIVLFIAVISVLQYVLLRLPWFQRFGASHPFLAWFTPYFLVIVLFSLFFRPKARRAEAAARIADLRQGRVKRMSLASRSAVLLTSMGLVVTGFLLQGRPYASVCLVLGTPALLLFALEELNIILRPGDSVSLSDRHDELVAFFRARTLQVGYCVAILSLFTLYLVSLFARQYVVVLLPIGLTISLLAPSLLYRRLDRRAEADE